MGTKEKWGEGQPASSGPWLWTLRAVRASPCTWAGSVGSAEQKDRGAHASGRRVLRTVAGRACGQDLLLRTEGEGAALSAGCPAWLTVRPLPPQLPRGSGSPRFLSRVNTAPVRSGQLLLGPGLGRPEQVGRGFWLPVLCDKLGQGRLRTCHVASGAEPLGDTVASCQRGGAHP